MRVVLSVCGGSSREDAALVCVLVGAARCALEYAFYLPSEDTLVVPHNFQGLFPSVVVRFRLRVGRRAVRTEEWMSMRVLTKKMCVCVCVFQDLEDVFQKYPEDLQHMSDHIPAHMPCSKVPPK